MFFGCGSQQTRTLNFAQAKHFDIPIPLNFKQVFNSSKELPEGFSDEVHLIGEKTKNPTEHFTKNLESFGWDITVVNGKATSITGTKPGKRLHMMISPVKDSWHVTFFILSDRL